MELHPMLDAGVTPNKGLWYVLATEGNPPSLRVGHTCTYMEGETKGDNGRVYIVGGADPGGSFCDMYVLDLNTLQWERIESPQFRARYEHAAIVPRSCPKEIYIFGGADQSGNMNSIQSFDTSSKSWSSPSVSGSSPPPRTFHNTVSVGNKLIVYSGGDKGADPVSDRNVYSFDASSSSWNVLTIMGDSPKPRHGHVMVAIGNKVYLHGGMAGQTFYDDLHVLDLDKSSWIHAKRKKTYPSARAGHAGVSSGENLYIFGGMNRIGALADMHNLNTVSMTWSQVELQGPPPACRLDFGMCVIQLERTVNHCDTHSTSLVNKQVHDLLEPNSASNGEASGARESETEEQTVSSGSQFDTDTAGTKNDVESETAELDRTNDRQLATEQCSEADKPGPGTEEDKSEGSRKTVLKLCLIHGGMDTEGEIFDDTLVMVLP